MFIIYNKKSDVGWTLIELLIVLVMLSLLMMLIMPNVSFVIHRAEHMAARQLLLESLSMAQLRDTLTLEESCEQFYQREEQRFKALDMTLRCRKVSQLEVRVIGEIPVAGTIGISGDLQLSSIHGFLGEI